MFERNMFGKMFGNSKIAVWALIKQNLEIFKVSIGLLGSICEESHRIYQTNQDQFDFLPLIDLKELNKHIIKFKDKDNT